MLHSPIGCENPPVWQGSVRSLQPIVNSTRLLNCMDGLSGILPFPASGERTRTRTRVDHRNTEEAALVRRVQARDEMAFREVVERYQAKVFSIIYGILRNHNDAEDIAQQVFSKTYSAIRSFDSRSSLLTWIYRITVNECYDYLRKRRARRVVYDRHFYA